MATNCWEFKKCGRTPGGSNEEEFGVCPAYTETRENGKNNGVNYGRYCWWSTGTFCGGKVQGGFTQKIAACQKCDFYELVKKEEGANFHN